MPLGESNSDLSLRLKCYAQTYNDPKYFEVDPSAFPRQFVKKLEAGEACLQDVEISAIISAHLAWGRRAMIVRDCGRAFDEMSWRPYEYVMNGTYRDEEASLHRTVKWAEFADICRRLKRLYEQVDSLEYLTPDQMRTEIYGQKSDLKAANKKIHMMRRWMVRRDGIVDFGLWRNIDPADLIIPLDVHVHQEALEMGITRRNSTDFTTALEITGYFRELFPEDPCLGDFALFGFGISK